MRAVGIGVIRNPFAGSWAENLRSLFEAGAALGERLMPELVRLLDGPAVSYGKGALVGIAGEMEHGGACVHPMLGRPRSNRVCLISMAHLSCGNRPLRGVPTNRAAGECLLPPNRRRSYKKPIESQGIAATMSSEMISAPIYGQMRHSESSGLVRPIAQAP